MHLRSYTVYDEDGAEFALKLFINDEDSDSDSKEEDASNSTSASSTYFIDADSGWYNVLLSGPSRFRHGHCIGYIDWTGMFEERRRRRRWRGRMDPTF